MSSDQATDYEKLAKCAEERLEEIAAMLRDQEQTLDWYCAGLIHIAEGRHQCTAASLARQILDGHVWDAKWAAKKQRTLETWCGSQRRKKMTVDR